MTNESFPNNPPHFVYAAQGKRHAIGVTGDGMAYSWGKSNAVGQLGRGGAVPLHSSIITNTTKTFNHQVSLKQPAPIGIQMDKNNNNKNNNNNNNNNERPFFVKAFVSQGCQSDSGHSALLDASGTRLFMAGCDRWQQLGLGSSRGGSSGYTWKQGKLWQDQFVPSTHVIDLMTSSKRQLSSENKTVNADVTIRDVALGGDHTLVLSSNQRDVYAFGKAGEGQLGLTQQAYLSAPVKSTLLSQKDSEHDLIAAVCAVDACSITLDKHGKILKHAGKCIGIAGDPIKAVVNGSASTVQKGFRRCQASAKKYGLVSSDD